MADEAHSAEPDEAVFLKPAPQRSLEPFSEGAVFFSASGKSSYKQQCFPWQSLASLPAESHEEPISPVIPWDLAVLAVFSHTTMAWERENQLLSRLSLI